MSGARSRNKGHGFERWVANALEKIFPDARRHLEYHKADAKGYDLDNTGPFRIQCKAYKAYAPISKIEEVEIKEGQIPMLVTKGDRKKAVAVMYFDDFIKLTTKDFEVVK